MIKKKMIVLSKYSLKETVKIVLDIISDERNESKLVSLNLNECPQIIFDVKASALFKNSFAPRISMKIKDNPDGVKVQFLYELKKAVKILLRLEQCLAVVFSLVMLTSLLFQGANSIKESEIWIIMGISSGPIVMVYVHYLFSILVCRVSARQIIKRWKRILDNSV